MSEFLSTSITRYEDNSLPIEWGVDKKVKWLMGEKQSYEIYQDKGQDRSEGEAFFKDYFLTQREPEIAENVIPGTTLNSFYYSDDKLVAFTSLFLCNFGKPNIEWHGLNVGSSIGIITRKSFSIRSRQLIDVSTGIPYIRLDNLNFINNTVRRFPRGTRFVICAHLQPESILLIKNLLKLARNKRFQATLKKLSKIDSVLSLLPDNILETYEFNEINDEKGTSYSTISFST